MNIIEPNVELIKQEAGFQGMLRQIERCGRTCYKSEDKITEDSAKQFVESLIERGHTAMLEHGTVYLMFRIDIRNRNQKVLFPWYDDEEDYLDNVFAYVQNLFTNNPYSRVVVIPNERYDSSTMYITTNYRVILENGWEDIMNEFISEQTEHHIPRITLKFTTNIGVTREGNRHRVNSIAEESTRCCDYTKEKHGNGEINIVPPVWINEELGMLETLDESEWMNHIEYSIRDGKNPDTANEDAIAWYGMAIAFAQVAYKNLRRLGWTPQQAREVLPLATKSEVVYTAYPDDWRHFFDLRLFGTTGAPHPNMKNVATKASNILIANDLWDTIYPDNVNNQI